MKEIFTRRSIRHYDLSKKVPEEDLNKVLRAGFAAPSARRQEPASFIIIDDLDTIAKLSLVSKGSMILTNTNMVICVMGADPKTLATPHMETQDLSACMENMMIEANHLGLGTCWIGIAPLEDRMNAVADILDIKDGYFPFSLMAIGYPLNNEDFKDLGRFYPERIHRNRY